MTFNKRFCLEFHSVARGHHINKNIWTPVDGEKLACKHDTREEAQLCGGHHIYRKIRTPVNGEKLACKHDTREEAQLYDDYAVGIYLDE